MTIYPYIFKIKKHMKCISWNCRSLRAPQEVRALRKLLASEVPDMVFLMETRKKVIKLEFLKNIVELNGDVGVDCRGNEKERIGGLMMLE